MASDGKGPHSSPQFGGVQEKIYLEEEMWWNYLDSTTYWFYLFFLRMCFVINFMITVIILFFTALYTVL